MIHAPAAAQQQNAQALNPQRINENIALAASVGLNINAAEAQNELKLLAQILYKLIDDTNNDKASKETIKNKALQQAIINFSNKLRVNFKKQLKNDTIKQIIIAVDQNHPAYFNNNLLIRNRNLIFQKIRIFNILRKCKDVKTILQCILKNDPAVFTKIAITREESLIAESIHNSFLNHITKHFCSRRSVEIFNDYVRRLKNHTLQEAINNFPFNNQQAINNFPFNNHHLAAEAIAHQNNAIDQLRHAVAHAHANVNRINFFDAIQLLPDADRQNVVANFCNVDQATAQEIINMSGYDLPAARNHGTVDYVNNGNSTINTIQTARNVANTALGNAVDSISDQKFEIKFENNELKIFSKLHDPKNMSKITIPSHLLKDNINGLNNQNDFDHSNATLVHFYERRYNISTNIEHRYQIECFLNLNIDVGITATNHNGSYYVIS